MGLSRRGFAYERGPTEVTSDPATWNYHWLTILRQHSHTADAAAAVAAASYHEPDSNPRATRRNNGDYRLGAADFNWALKEGYIVRADGGLA